jgi:hypothetical protein
MYSPGASQAIRDAYGLFWRKKSGKRLPPELKGISFTNATTFSTRVRLRLLKEMSRRHQLSNPSLSCYVTNYTARPELKIRDRRGMVTSLTYTKAVQQLPHHLTLSFLRDLFQYARTNLPEREVVERFLILTPDLLLGSLPEQLSMSTDDIPASQNDLMSLPSVQPTTTAVVTTATSGLLGTSGVPNLSQPPPPFQQLVPVVSDVPNSQFVGTLPSTVVSLQGPPINTITYASVASLPHVSSGPPVSLFTTSTPAPQASTPAYANPIGGSPTYAILTPVEFTPPNPQTGSFLPVTGSSGTDPGANNDPLSKRTHHRFAQKSAPYPTPN